MREGVVFASNACREPLPGDFEQSREAPDLNVRVEFVCLASFGSFLAVLAKIFFESQLCQEEGDFLWTAALELVQVMNH